MSRQDIRLRDLWQSRRGMWAVAWLLGAVTLLATVALLAVSGWFISAAAAAGVAALSTAYMFDYFRPGAIIRALGIVRTAGRYGERLASHNAVLALLRDLRVRFFGRLAVAPGRADVVSAGSMHRLTSDIDLLDQWPLRFLMPWLWALLLQTAFVLWLLLAAPALLLYVLPPLLLAGVVLPALAAWRGMALARQDTQAAEERRRRESEPTLTMLRNALLEEPGSDAERHALQRMREMHELIDRLVTWFDDVQKLSPQTAMQLMGMGAKVTKVLGLKDRLTGAGGRSSKASAADEPH